VLAGKADAIAESETGADAIEKVYEIIKTGLVGWANMIDPETEEQIDYKPDDLDLLLTLPEANELLAKMRDQGLNIDELKN